MKTQEPMIQILLKDSTSDIITKMLFGYALHMPHNEKFYYEKLNAVLDYAEECLTMHPGAFAGYITLREKLPAAQNRTIPEPFKDYIEEKHEEIEKYYGNPVPQKYRKTGIIEVDKRLVGADGQILGADPVEKPKLVLV